MGQMQRVDWPNLFHGVSRQPAEVRLPGQLENVDNAVLSPVVGGAMKRPGSETIRRIFGQASDDAFGVHFYKRDANEKYMILAGDMPTGQAVLVFDMTSFEYRTVNTTTNYHYLDADNPYRDLAFVTIADTTFVVNKTKTVQLKPAPAGPSEQGLGVIEISQGFESVRYTVEVTTEGQTVTVEIDSGSSDVTEIAEQLADALETELNGFEVDRSGSHIFLRRTSGANWGLELDDGLGGAMRGISWYAYNLERLPLKAWHGQTIRIGSSEDEYYWVSASTEDEGEYGDVRYAEVPAPDTRLEFDESTMPHIIQRQADGSFTFRAAEWGKRRSGSEDTQPPPDFVGHTISDVQVHRDRLVLASGEKLWFSRVDDYTGFWPKVSTQVLDDDPFGRTVGGSTVNNIRHVMPFRETLWLTSDLQQFEVSSQGPLTPRTAVVDPATVYPIERHCRPVRMGSELYFASGGASYSQLYEYYYDEDTLSSAADDVSIHVRGYLPPTLRSLTADPARGTVFCLTEAPELYLYNVHWEGNEKPMSSWGRWSFPACRRIRHIEVVDDDLWLLWDSYGNQTYLDRVPLHKTTSYQFEMRLDHLQLLYGTSMTYNEFFDETTIQVRHDVDGSVPTVVNLDTFEELEVIASGSFQVRVKGQHDASFLAVGFVYPMSLEFGAWHLREQAPGQTGPGRAITTGRFNLKRFWVRYRTTPVFHVFAHHPDAALRQRRVDWRKQDVYRYRDQYPQYPSGNYECSVRGRGDLVKIIVESAGIHPATFLSAGVVGFFNERSRQG